MNAIVKSILSGATAFCLLAGAVGCSSTSEQDTSSQGELESSISALSQQITELKNKPDSSADILAKQSELESALDSLIQQVGALAETEAVTETDSETGGETETEPATVETEIETETETETEPVTVETEVETETETEAAIEASTYPNHAEEAYAKLCYIDKMLPDRDCFAGENFLLCQKWIHSELLQAGYTEADIVYQDVPMSKYVPVDDPDSATSALTSVTTDGKTYSREGWKYVEVENGTHTKATGNSQNIIVTKPGKSPKKIIVAMHYDGTGTGDNGSGVALGLATAQAFHDIETPYTIQFVFLTGEEYGMYGSLAFVAAMSEEEIADTLYMINMDSLVCGDYCYLYGGVQDDETKTVSATGAYDNAMQVAETIGLSFKSNPWTWDKLSPDDIAAGQTTPSYASPSTGNWSDHALFAQAGIPYLYLEATNWDIPDYTGYGETYLIGMLMNTENDYLDYIEAYFPGRPMHHLKMFSTLLDQLLMQADVEGIVG